MIEWKKKPNKYEKKTSDCTNKHKKKIETKRVEKNRTLQRLKYFADILFDNQHLFLTFNFVFFSMCIDVLFFQRDLPSQKSYASLCCGA